MNEDIHSVAERLRNRNRGGLPFLAAVPISLRQRFGVENLVLKFNKSFAVVEERTTTVAMMHSRVIVGVCHLNLPEKSDHSLSLSLEREREKERYRCNLRKNKLQTFPTKRVVRVA